MNKKEKLTEKEKKESNKQKKEKELFDTATKEGLLDQKETATKEEGFSDITIKDFDISNSSINTTNNTFLGSAALKLEETLEEDERGKGQEEINREEDRIRKYGQTRPTQEDEEETEPDFNEIQGELYGASSQGEFYSSGAGGEDLYSAGGQSTGGNLYSTGEAGQSRGESFYSPTQTTSTGGDFYSGKNEKKEKEWVKSGMSFTSELEKKTKRKVGKRGMDYGTGNKKAERTWN